MNFKNRLARFLYGRYGTDNLYNALFLTQIIVLFLGAVLNLLGHVSATFAIISYILYSISLVLFGFTLFRFFSRNITKRRIENQKYLRFRERWHSRFRLLKNRFREGKTHVFRRCKQCKATLRLPRKRGRHAVKCPCCQQRFHVTILFGASDKARKND